MPGNGRSGGVGRCGRYPGPWLCFPAWIVAFCLLIAVRSAGAAPSPDPWQAYIAAAVDSAVAGDYPSVEGLLEAALGVAKQGKDDDPRPTMTRFVLQYAYVAQNKMDQAKEVGRQGFHLDVAMLHEDLLPFAHSLARLADNAYTRSTELAKNKEKTAEADQLMYFAADFMMLETAIYRRTEPDGSSESASALGFYGLVLQKQGKLSDAIDRFQEALQVWKKLDAREQQISMGGRRLTLFQERISTGGRTSTGSMGGDNPHIVRILLARNYTWRAEDELDSKKTDAANDDFAQAEALYKQAISSLANVWPNHANVAGLYRQLGYMYEGAKRTTEAEQAYRQSLEMYTTIEGPRGDNTTSDASDLAGLLRKENRIPEATDIETRYGLSTPAKN